MHSSHNDSLRWPFKGKVTVAAQNYEGTFEALKDYEGWIEKPSANGRHLGRGWTPCFNAAVELYGVDSLDLRVKVETDEDE